MNHLSKTLAISFSVFYLVFLAGCSSIQQQSPSLFHQLGGNDGLDKLVDSFIQEIANDPRLFEFFRETKVSRFREKIREHLCALSDGPCTYTGDTMEDVHAGMHIQEADFNRMVEVLIRAMENNDVPITVQNKLLKRMAPMRDQIYKR